MYKVIADKAADKKIIFHSPPPSEPEALTQIIFGVSVAQFAQGILKNAGGMFDAVFIGEEAAE